MLKFTKHVKNNQKEANLRAKTFCAEKVFDHLWVIRSTHSSEVAKSQSINGTEHLPGVHLAFTQNLLSIYLEFT